MVKERVIHLNYVGVSDSLHHLDLIDHLLVSFTRNRLLHLDLLEGYHPMHYLSLLVLILLIGLVHCAI